MVNAKSKPLLESMGESLVNALPEDPAGYLFERLGIDSPDEGSDQDA